MMYPFFDPTMVLLIPAMIFSMWAQFKVKGTFAKYSEKNARSGVSADRVSRVLLDKFGLTGVRVERISGDLTDHYDPRAKVLRLSDSVAGNTSI
ncbi:MAG: zinc metallopeptidase, partial [Synergistaceae bacterium]